MEQQDENTINYKQGKQRKPLSFGKTLLASTLGVIIAGVVLSVLSMIISIAMMVSMMSSLSGDNEVVTVKPDTFVHLNLQNQVKEVAPNGLESVFNEDKVNGADQILAGLAHAKDDDNVKGLYVTVGGTSGLTWGLAEELRNAILDFKESGKPVVFYGEHYSQVDYYLATAANKILLHSDGMVEHRGIGSQVMYYKDLFDKLGVKVDLIRPTSCAYKSAGETYTMNHMSDANREQIHVYINSIWNHVSTNIATARSMDVQTVNELADNLTGFLAKDAYKAGLVDSLCYDHDARMITKAMGRSHTLNMSKYYASISAEKKDAGKNKIAVIYAEGGVNAGSYPGYGDGIYTAPIVKALNDAATNDKVVAIVLRVNSPGGAATTSQSITDAVRKAKTHKPVVVSMSDYAASAGYEMSCLADYIVAQPTTITGSIGVFGTVPEIGGMLKKKIGLTFDTAQTNKNSAGISLVTPMSPVARAMMQRNVEDFYVTFVSTVAEGRKLEYKYVDSIARGRVWTGADAVKLGLVDTLGGINDAVRIAARLANTNNYTTQRYPAQKSWMSQVFNSNSDNEDNSFEPSFSLMAKVRMMFSAKQRILDYQSKMRTIDGRLEQDLLNLTGEPTLQARMPFYVVSE